MIPLTAATARQLVSGAECLLIEGVPDAGYGGWDQGTSVVVVAPPEWIEPRVGGGQFAGWFAECRFPDNQQLMVPVRKLRRTDLTIREALTA